ncbi:mechanosensitive ion channel family protein [Silvibacterium acidisoli]|uniref:mechanosensitive ion channel family protein n=1 Tax=Acidobacteriaceae bacterium ZG23-2 TaxID=2883246 RepID=UPI00406D4D07
MVCTTLFAQSPQPSPNPSRDAASTDKAILNHLSLAITWYRATKDKVQPTGLPTDTIFQGNMQSLAAEAVQQAFQSALAQAALEAAAEKSDAKEQQSPANVRNLQALSDQLKSSTSSLQSQLNQLNQQIATTSGSKAAALRQQRDRLEGELNLDQTMNKSVSQIVSFVDQNEQGGGSSLAAGIRKLQQSVPELVSGSTAKATTVASNANALQHSSGLIGQSITLYDQGEVMRQLSEMIEQTSKLEDAARQLRTPLLNELKGAVKQSQTLAAAVDGAQPGQPLPSEADFNNISKQFDHVAAAELPLSKELILLDQSKANMTEWRDSISHEYGRRLRAVLTRVGGIAIVIAILLALSELWKRVTFRYVRDLRRRRQFLLIRRIVITFLMGLVVVLGFVSELSSLATFAGFITAGLAVGLQTILLSVAAYFFLVGRYGIRVGDRITISGVTGDVADVGLVRFYLMELAGTGIDMYPTGRLVVFSNAILFTATTPLFKQVPGTEYAWHEVALQVNPQSDLKGVEEKLLAVVTDAFKHYRSDLERQHGEVERRIEINMQAPVPKGLLQFTDVGLEAVVRYPVSLQHLSDVDDQISRALAVAVEEDAAIKAAVVGLPKLRAAVKQ